MSARLQEIELVNPHGQRCTVFRYALVIDLCDHEHNEGDPMCEDAREALSGHHGPYIGPRTSRVNGAASAPSQDDA